MAEVAAIKAATNPHETLLVADSLTGQDAVNIARNFNDRVHAHRHHPDPRRRRCPRRRGAFDAQRHRRADQVPGRGRKARRAGAFHPDRVAARILDMGDVVSLVEKAAETLDKDRGGETRRQDEERQFDMDDLADQLAR